MGINLKGIKKFLGKLTDLLLIGRQKGWWDKKKGPNVGDGGLQGPK